MQEKMTQNGGTHIQTDLNSHFATFVLVIFIWVQSWEEREIQPIDVAPIIGVAVEGDESRLVLGVNPSLQVRLAAPLPRFLVRVRQVGLGWPEDEDEGNNKLDMHWNDDVFWNDDACWNDDAREEMLRRRIEEVGLY